MKTYVLTGGPGCGKSSILLHLELQRGEHIIREAAEDYIRFRQAQGQPGPWTEPDFQEKIMELQLQRKAKIPQGIERVFVDRDIADGLAYAQPGELYNKILSKAQKQNCEKVFLIETLGNTESNAVRRENHDEATELGNKLEEIYRNLGYKPIRIPKATVEERARMILENL